jgi:hypothetical protein
MSSQGTVCAKSQVIDYRARGVELESYNVVSFYMDTYERKILPGDQFEDEDERLTSVKRGRPRNDRVRYLSDHPKAKTVLRIIRSKVHNNLPNFIGRRFPRGDDPDTYDFYCASMLMLLKPWRDLNRDLKRSGETWAESFAAFRETAASLEDQAILSGIAYLHDCETAASKDQSKHDMTEGREERYEDEEELEDQDEGADEDMETSGRILTEDGLEAIIRAQTSLEEEVHARLAIELAKRAKIFQNEGEGDAWEAWDRQTVVGNATGDDLHRLARWRNQLETEVAKINESSRMGDVQKDLGGPQCVESGVVRPINVDSNAASEVLRVEVMNVCNSTRHNDETYDVLSAADPSDLNIDQRRAYDIIIWHLEQTLAGNEPPPLRMIIHGEGGTGKSKVLQTVTQTFKDRGCQNMLLKAAYTGVAASVIEGKTTHVIGGISAAVSRYDANEAVADETKVKLEKFWEQYKYLALDEMSMLAKDFFALLSRNAGIGKGNIDGRSFGGVNVIILGDFHQFPPVARPIRDALYYPSNAETDSLGSQIGRAIYEEFTMVVTLKEQKRVTDPVWHDFLRNLRTGSVNAGHVQMLRSLIIGEKSSDNVDFESEPWNDASLVTPRHAVRVHWNNAALRKMCREKGQSIFICRAEDTIRGRSIGLRERYALESHRGNSKRNRGSRTSKDLPYQIEIAIGMKVMVTNNVETDLDITNGARGVIVDIVLHPDEPPINRNDAVIRLKYLPSYLLVKLTRTRATRLEGLDECVIPIESGTTSYRIKIMVGGKMVQRTVKRKQYPLTAAYGFTDYRSQGQTIPYVIVDIAMPPTGGLNLFNLYVALSRSSGRNTIRLLRNFDDKLFEKQHDGALLQEDERLEALDRQTVQWYERVIQAHQSQP